MTGNIKTGDRMTGQHNDAAATAERICCNDTTSR